MNQVILVGRITVIKKDYIKISADKSDADIKIILPEAIREASKPYLKKNAFIGIKAHIEAELKGRYGTVTSIVAEKLTLISHGKE